MYVVKSNLKSDDEIHYSLSKLILFEQKIHKHRDYIK